MKIGVVGPTGRERSLPFNAQRSVNCFTVLDKMGKEPAALYGTPGLLLFTTAGTGPIRGVFSTAAGRAFAVSGYNLYELYSDGSIDMRGTLNSATGVVTIDENGLQLMICDGGDGYIFTYATNAFAQISDVSFPEAGSVTFIDGYFVVNEVNTGKFYISSLYDGLTWGGLDFATAESSPDDLLRPINAVGTLWLLGTKTGEIWTNTGASSFPFERTAGGKMETGIYATNTAVATDNSLLWVGRDNYGAGVVFRAQGYTPQRISTNPIERILQAAPEPDTLRAYTYQEEGHVFYVITGGGMETTLAYDISTQLWHERAYLDTSGSFTPHLGECGMYAFGKTLVGSRINGEIYIMSLDLYSDNGNEMVLERVFTYVSDENKRIRYNRLEIGFESGVGLQEGQGSDPVCTLSISKDGARTWTDPQTCPIGKVGKYFTTVAFRRLGVAKSITFKLRVSDPIKRAITGAYLF